MIRFAIFLVSLAGAPLGWPAVVQAQASAVAGWAKEGGATEVAAPAASEGATPVIPPALGPQPASVASPSTTPVVTRAPAPEPSGAPAPPFLGPSPGEKGGAIGFGIALLPNAELVGTSGALGLKVWLSDRFALAPLLLLRYTSPSSGPATWNIKPEIVFLAVPWKSGWTRFELGGGVGFGVTRTSSLTGSVAMNGDPEFDTVSSLNVSLPLQIGVEHFVARWLSLGLAARMPVVEYNRQASEHELSFSLDTTKLLAQVFIYSD
jgi:hypothetical protein